MPDSFRANVIAVAGIASGVVIVVVPVGLRTLGPGDPLKDFLEALGRFPEEGERAPPSRSRLIAEALFISAIPSPLSFLGDTVLSFVAWIGFSLCSNLHGDDRFFCLARLRFPGAGVPASCRGGGCDTDREALGKDKGPRKADGESGLTLEISQERREGD